MEYEVKIAVFFDAENISENKVSLIIDSLSAKGDILFQRAYADWSIETTKSWKEQLNKTPITAIQQFHHNEKQAVDKLIMMDAIEMAIKHEEINTFAIITSDNGFHSLALRLRELGKRVIGIGEKGGECDKSKCKPIWIKACNEFLYIEDLDDSDEDVLLNDKEKMEETGLDDKEKVEDTGLKDFSLEKFIENAYDKTPFYKGTNVKLVSQVWETIYRLKSDFNVKDYGVKSSLELLRKFDKKFSVSDDGKNQRTFFVEKIENDNCQRKLGVISRRIKSYRIISADDASGDYFFYMSEINRDFKGEILEKGTKVDFQVVKEPDLNAVETKDKNGRATDVCVIK